MSLLAVDLGVRTGLALYGANGRLVWYRSHNFGSAARLKKGAPGILRSCPELDFCILEGGGPLAEIWEREALRRELSVTVIAAEVWRQHFFHPRERKDASHAKASAGQLARSIISWAGAKAPSSLRHDAAEAVCIGLWGVLHTGLLQSLPTPLVKRCAGLPPVPRQ